MGVQHLFEKHKLRLPCILKEEFDISRIFFFFLEEDERLAHHINRLIKIFFKYYIGWAMQKHAFGHYANSEGPGQPVHAHSLIRTCAFRKQ